MSHYLRCITLAERYSEYEVLFAHSEKYNMYVERAGFKSFFVEHFDSDMVMQQAAEFKFSWLNYNDIERIYTSQVKAITEHKPCMVISDTAPTLKMAAEKTNAKHVSLMNAYMCKYYDGTRGVSRTHYSYQHLQKLPPNVAKLITRLAEKAAFNNIHKPFKQLRKLNNLGKKKNYLDELEGDENLICDSSEIFQLRNAPANYRFIGPLSYNNTTIESTLIQSLDTNKPVICVCLGSSGNWPAIKFLAQEKYAIANWIIAGDLTKQLQAPHLSHRDFINLNTILPLCDLLICHGGNGTIYEGLKHKKQMLFFTNHFEQEWNAQRLSELGLGEIINDAPEKKILGMLEQISQKLQA